MKKNNRRKKKRLEYLGIVLGVIGVIGTIITIIAYKAYLNDKKTNPTSGTLYSPRPAEKRILAVGSVRITINSTDGVLLSEDNDPLISIHKFGDKLFVSAVIRNSSGEIVARLDENEWQLNQGNYYDRNFTQKAIEVIDHSDRVVLQVVDFGDIIHLAGVFHRKDGSPFALIPAGELGALMVTGSNNHYVFLSSAYSHRNPSFGVPHFDNPQINPIFEYPSDKHPGSCPGIDNVTKLVRQSDNDDKYKGYNFSGPVDIGVKRLLK